MYDELMDFLVDLSAAARWLIVALLCSVIVVACVGVMS